MHIANRKFRSALLVSAAAAAVIGLSPSVLAQGDGVETVVVTGSRIPVADYTSNSPLQTINGNDIGRVGSVGIENYLNTLPQFNASFTKTQNNPPAGGASYLDLRQLGSERTLVLVDGQRMVPYGASADLSILPSSIVDRVEVITGGASAVYGSDAIAGVVNIITKKDFEGIQTTAKYGVSGHRDGEEYNVDTMVGGNFAGGKGNATLTFSYNHRAAIGQGDRSYTKEAQSCNKKGCTSAGSETIPDGSLYYGDYNSDTGIGITQSAWSAFIASKGWSADTPLVNPYSGGVNIGFNPDGSIFALSPTTGYTGPYKDYDPTTEYTYNYNPDNYLVTPFERYSVNGAANYKLNENVEFYTKFLFSDYSSTNVLAPAPNGFEINLQDMGASTLKNYSSDLYNLLIASGYTDDTLPTTYVVRRSNELGRRTQKTTTKAYQGTIGVRGSFPSFNNKTWNYDVFASYGRYSYEMYNTGYLSTTRLTDALTGCKSGNSTCVKLNPFGAGSITEDQSKYIGASYYDDGMVWQQDVEGNLSGDIVDLPAGPLGFALGFEYRAQHYEDTPDDALQQGDINNANIATALAGGFNVIEVYGETKVPVLKDLPGIKYLGLEGGFRYSDYSTKAGTTRTFKYGGEYSPFDGIRFRGLIQKAVRAPSIYEMYSQQTGDFPKTNLSADPCSTGSVQRNGAHAAQVLALCQAQAPNVNFGVYNPSYTPGSTQLYAIAGGNTDLKPESAHTWTLGAVVNPPEEWLGPWLSNLNLSVDYYHITVTNVIDSVNPDTSLTRCYDAAYNPTFSIDNTYCAAIHRNPSGGGLSSLTAPYGYITETNRNLGAKRVQGLDLAANYAFDTADTGIGSFGMLNLSLNSSYLFKYLLQSLPGEKFEERAGTIGDGSPQAFGTALPHWKHTATIAWSYEDFDLSLRWERIGAVNNVKDTNPDDITHIKPYDYFYLNGNWNVTSYASLNVGVDNLFDKKPPIYTQGFQYNTDPSTYDVIGRYFFMSVTLKG